jgi:hypothetical protein
VKAVTESRRGTTNLILALSAATGLIATYVVAVRTGRGQTLDYRALRGQVVQPRPIQRVASGLLGTISVVSLGAVTTLLVALAAFRGRRLLGVAVGAIVAGSVISTELLKHSLYRPLLSVQFGNEIVNTLPSGHSTVALSVVVAAVVVVPRRFQALIALLGSAYSIGIGIATVVARWHRPSDVVAATFMVAVWAFAGLFVLSRLGGVGTAPDAAWSRWVAPVAFMLLLLATAVLAATTLFGVSLAGGRSSLPAGTLRSAAAFGFSTASIAALQLAFLSTLLWRLRSVNLHG